MAGATAGTGIAGEMQDFPSLAMEPQSRPPQAWIQYSPRNEELENPPEIVAKIYWSNHGEQIELDSIEWGGVYVPPRKRNILFSQSVELRLADLPQRRPRISPLMIISEEDGPGRNEEE